MAVSTYLVVLFILLADYTYAYGQCDNNLSRKPSYDDFIQYAICKDDLFIQHFDDPAFDGWVSTGDWVHTLTYGQAYNHSIRVFLSSDPNDGSVSVTNATTDLGDMTFGGEEIGHYLLGNGTNVTAIISFNPPVGAVMFRINPAQGTVAEISVYSSLEEYISCNNTIEHSLGINIFALSTQTYKIRHVKISGTLFVVDPVAFTPCPLGSQNQGYVGDNDEALCVDVNECETGSVCNANAECTNLLYSYECACKNGWEGNGSPDQDGCVDIDECKSNPCVQEAKCHNLEGSFYCSCSSGFEGDGLISGNGCQDIDECSTNPCSPDAQCNNNEGSYSCTCNPGYEGNGVSCDDVDECNEDPCDENASCDNTPGSYSCTCNTGFEGNGVTCQDVNECDDDPCANNAQCTNFPGSYECECNEGFKGDGTTSCNDINECGNAIYPCSEYADCRNTAGSYECTCIDGYEGDGKECSDINECDGNPCSLIALCANNEGSFECTCPNGYSGNGFGADGCVNVNECTNSPCATHATCQDTDGSYTCSCPQGYTGDGYNECTDINECDSDPCSPVAQCHNTNGSFTCTCPDGFNGDGLGDNGCTDIDECVQSPCDTHATCNNTAGSFLCTCNEGYEGDGVECTPRADTGNTPLASAPVVMSPPVTGNTPVSEPVAVSPPVTGNTPLTMPGSGQPTVSSAQESNQLTTDSPLIAAIVVPVLAVLGVGAAIFVIFWSRRRQRQNDSYKPEENSQ